MKVEVSIGEIVDKLTILHIKKSNISNDQKLQNIINEYNYLYEIVFNQLEIEQKDYDKLILINKELWDIEDLIRLKERSKEFDDEFISLARKVYITNDKRAELKKVINLKYHSTFVEEKSYEQYESFN